MSQENPTVSLITATYNRRALLPRLAESLQAQTLTNFEWIVVDDGSTDGTAHYIGSLHDPRIKLLRQSNQGCNAARNLGEKEIRAEFVVFIDSDDELVSQDTLRIMVERISNTSESIGVVAFSVLTPEGGGGESRLAENEILVGYSELLCGNRVEGEFLRIFKRQALLGIPWASGYAGMEILKYLAIAKKYKTLYVRELALIYHMNHGDNLTSARQTILRASSMIDGYEELIRENKAGFRDACPKALGLNLFHTAMYCAIDGQSYRAFRHSLSSMKEQGPFINNLILIASLLLPLAPRQQLFIWRSKRKGRL